jgi:hypothetical protein
MLRIRRVFGKDPDLTFQNRPDPELALYKFIILCYCNHCYKIETKILVLNFMFDFRVVIDPGVNGFGIRIDFLGEYDAKCETALGLEAVP